MMRWLVTVGCAAALFAQKPIDQAWKLAADGHRPEAIALLRELVHATPNDADQRLLLGSLLMEEGDKDHSLEQLNAAVRLRPRSEEALNAIGEAYNKFGDPKAAKVAFEKAIAIKPAYGIAQSNLGMVLLSTGESAAAARHLDRAITLLGQTDDAADALYLRAKIFTSSGNAHSAEMHLRKAVSIRPNFAEAWSDLGQACKTQLDAAGALAAFEKAVAINPDDAIAQYRLGAELLTEGNPHAAREHLQASARLNPTDQSTLNALQTALRRDGDIEGANRVKRQLADMLVHKDEANQNQLRAIKLNNDAAETEKQGDLQRALPDYAEAARLYPDHPGIHLNYGLALLKTGQWQPGLDQLREALKLDPASDKIKTALEDALRQAPR